MGKNKLRRYAENAKLDIVFEHTDFDEKEPPAGKWAETIFGNQNPVVLELACGKGDYTTALARRNPDKNYIGIDIKGDRIWKGALRAKEEGLNNVRFLRCYIDHLDSFFEKCEISDIWITFPDPYLKKSTWKKRLTAPKFLSIYRKISSADATINLKTDSTPLFRFTLDVVNDQGLKIIERVDDVYAEKPDNDLLFIKTYYEKKHLAIGRTIQFIRFSLHP